MLSVEVTECKPLSERIKNVEANYIMQSGKWILSAYQFSRKWDNENNAIRRNLNAWVRPALRFVHHTVRTRTRFFTKKGSGTFLFHKMFSMPRVCRTVNRNEQRQDTTIMAMVSCLLYTIWYWRRSLRTKRLKPLCLLRSAQRSAPLWRRTCHPHKQMPSRCPQGRAVPPAHNGA